MSSAKDAAIAAVDIDQLITDRGWSVETAKFVLGLTSPAFSQVVRSRSSEPVKNPTLALLVQLLQAFPEAAIVPELPSAQEIAGILNPLGLTTMRELAIASGKEASAGHRLLSAGSRPTPTMLRLFYALKTILEDPLTRDANFEIYKSILETEAAAREVSDLGKLFKTGAWSEKPRKPRKSQAKLNPAKPGRKRKPKAEDSQS